MKKLSSYQVIGLLSSVLASTVALSAFAASPTVPFVEGIQVSARVKAGNWSKRKDLNNRTSFYITATPTDHKSGSSFEFLMQFTSDQDKLKNGEWLGEIPFSVAPSHLDRLNLNLTVKRFGFKAIYTLDFLDLIPYVLETSTAKYPIDHVNLRLSEDALSRVHAGEAIDLKKSYADGTELVVSFKASPTVEMSLDDLKLQYETDCKRYSDHMRSVRPLGSDQAYFGLKEKIAEIRSVILENDPSWVATNCLTQKILR